MRLQYDTEAEAEASALAIHNGMIARVPSYAASVIAGQTTAWATPYTSGGDWFVDCKPRCAQALSAVQSAALKPYSDAGTTLLFKSYLATGSISAVSNELTLVSNPGFAEGDSIIVELGGEAGAGARGTVGVGGTWPALSYANHAAMVADTSKPDTTYAWLADTKDVYQWIGGVWVVNVESNYYARQCIPRALVATITGVAGLVLTLDTSAVVTSTGASVHYDNAAIFNDLTDYTSAYIPENRTLIIPEGSFAVSSRLVVPYKYNWTVRGQGEELSEIFSPEGVSSAQLQFGGAYFCCAADFHIHGNARDNGFGLDYTFVNETSLPQGLSYPRGVYFETCFYGAMYGLKVTDAFQMCVGSAGSTGVWAAGCDIIMTEGLQGYVQWRAQWSDSVGGGSVDCTIDSPYLIAGFEAFRSDDVAHIRPVGRNTVCALNSCGRWLFDSPVLTIEANSQKSEASFAASTPIFGVNSNISPPSGAIAEGGTLRNPTIIQEGVINASNDRLKIVVVNYYNPNVIIEGDYPAPEPNDGGLLESSDWVSGGALDGGTAVTADTPSGVIVRGIRAKGEPYPGQSNIVVPLASTVTDCVADYIVGGTQTGCMTNAEYEAL